MEEEEVRVTKRSRRELPSETVRILKDWMLSPAHVAHPYPTEVEKKILMQTTEMDSKQISNWFTNARKRIWKPLMKRDIESRMFSNLVHILPNDGNGNGVMPRLRTQSEPSFFSPSHSPNQVDAMIYATGIQTEHMTALTNGMKWNMVAIESDVSLQHDKPAFKKCKTNDALSMSFHSRPNVRSSNSSNPWKQNPLQNANYVRNSLRAPKSVRGTRDRSATMDISALPSSLMTMGDILGSSSLPAQPGQRPRLPSISESIGHVRVRAESIANTIEARGSGRYLLYKQPDTFLPGRARAHSAAPCRNF